MQKSTAVQWIAAGLAALLSGTFHAPSAVAQQGEALEGIALVIGQADYEYLDPLANPANDAREIAGLLTALGFDTRVAGDRGVERLQRELDRFVEDAEFADVALLYYSGHGIEAGGENWLVPVDADLSALDNAAEALVPLSSVLERLRETVPVTIVLLDACRSNPFPPGAAVTVAVGAAPVPVGDGGLATPKGALGLGRPASGDLGSVIGFAAEPGQVALDGAEGTNSPYAAALLRHLSAIDGAEFGTVMRMVTEEVYLKTRTRQRPWVNESLRRLLYFGVAAETGNETGDEGLITRERRQLLVTIAALPSADRSQVESIARSDEVPLDALYAALTSLNQRNPTASAGDFAQQLRSSAETIRRITEERRALSTDDPELVRLASLADTAVDEGAIGAARQFLDRAVARVEARRDPLDDLEARLAERRLADAAIYARRAETAMLDADLPAAAADYAEAFRLAERWDRQLAWEYKWWEAATWQLHGELNGDRAALETAVERYDEALAFVPRGQKPLEWAETRDGQATALLVLGRRDEAGDRLRASVAAYQSALEERTRDVAPFEWARTQNNLGNALSALAERTGELADFEAALAAYQAAAQQFDRDDNPDDWALNQSNLGTALVRLGERDGGTGRLEAALAAYGAALTVWTRDESPYSWAVVRNNIGNALKEIGARQGDPARFEQSVAAYRDAIEGFPRHRAPIDWAMAHHNLAGVLRQIGAATDDPAILAEAIAAAEAALAERTRERTPIGWAQTQVTLANALSARAGLQGDAAQLRRAVATYQAALEEISAEELPFLWAMVQGNRGAALRMLGSQLNDPAPIEEAVTAYQAALAIYSRDEVPLDWAFVQNNLAGAIFTLGVFEWSPARVEESIAAMQAAIDAFVEAGVAPMAEGARGNLAYARDVLEKMRADQP